jgi:hypothetical protein
MSKSLWQRVIYGVLALVGLVLLIREHSIRHAELMIFASFLLVCSLFVAHWPLSWKNHTTWGSFWQVEG